MGVGGQEKLQAVRWGEGEWRRGGEARGLGGQVTEGGDGA